MPEPTIEVDYDALDAKAAELQRIKTGLDAWKNGSQITSMFGSVGHKGLSDELNSFHSGWHDGVDEIEKCLEGAVALLKTAAEKFRSADQQVARAAAGGGGG